METVIAVHHCGITAAGVIVSVDLLWLHMTSHTCTEKSQGHKNIQKCKETRLRPKY